MISKGKKETSEEDKQKESGRVPSPSYIERNQEEEPDEAAEPQLRRPERHAHPVPVKVLLVDVAAAGRAVVVQPEPRQGPLALVVGQELGVRGGVRHREEAEDAEERRDDALDYAYASVFFRDMELHKDTIRLTEEDPGPPVVAVEADLRQARREKPAERAGQRRGAVEVADAAEHLVALVEHGEVDDDAAEQAALEGAQEQPRDYKPGQGLGEAQECGDDSPGRDERW